MTYFISVLLWIGSAFAAPPAQTNTQTLYDAWYIVKANRTVPYAFYNEKAEIKDGRVFMKSSLTRKEDGELREENLGLVSQATNDLAPQFYNLRSVGKGLETILDANVGSNRILQVRVRQAGQEYPMIKKTLPKGTIWVTTFPVWLMKNWKDLQTKKTLAFHAVLEDAYSDQFPILNGRVSLQPEDEFAKKSKTTKLKIELGDRQHFWWVDSQPVMQRFESPKDQLLVEKVDEQTAQKFLSTP